MPGRYINTVHHPAVISLDSIVLHLAAIGFGVQYTCTIIHVMLCLTIFWRNCMVRGWLMHCIIIVYHWP